MGAENIPQLTPVSTVNESAMHGIGQLLVEFKNHVGQLENKLTTKSQPSLWPFTQSLRLNRSNFL